MSDQGYPVNPVKRGYFVPQDISVAGPDGQFIVDLSPDWYVNTREAARVQLEEWRKRELEAVEFIPMVFQPADVPGVADIAKMARDYGLDLWLTPRLLKTFNCFPIVPNRFAGKHLTEEGRIVTALKNWSMRPDLDFFNSEAVEWLFGIFREEFLDRFEQNGFQGFRWPEEFHGHSLYGRTVEKGLIPYWQRPAYSDRSLEQWRDYCRRNEVRHEGRVVDRFPVDRPEMESRGGGKTAFYPGLNARPDIVSDEPVSTWPRNSGVWAHWDAYRCKAYMNNYLLPFSRMMHEANRANPTWHGVEYFGSSGWLLAYEKVNDPGVRWKGGGWGYQCGMDAEVLGRSPEITHITHEFRGKVAESHLEARHDLFLSLVTPEASARHGLLLNGDTDFTNKAPTAENVEKVLEKDEEVARWRFVRKYQPRIISMWSLAVLHPKHPFYRREEVEKFWRRLRAYQACGDPFVDEKMPGAE